ncbi:histone acetyltransferase KAT6B [Caerostris extrusa]|uniref:Histone acetyltransferase KAT6B n=1 Tax=Caerostris extrusa TaxID=172846 RepID=A0AAV4Q6K3_CAEEX|nr:histone acetyltransferase KAT6B [Caerostris extrusa]
MVTFFLLGSIRKAVSSGSIVKVFTKGLCSYKDPGTLCNLKSRTLRIHPGTDMRKVIVKAIKELGSSSSFRASIITTPKKSNTSVIACNFCRDISTAKNDHLISCCLCGTTGHTSCFGLLPEALQNIDETKWECSRCKICVVCGLKTEHKRMLTCNLCDKIYHATCVEPVFPRPARGAWRCSSCKRKP